ncbi:MAG: hypothetical protein IKZ82_13035 [Clostridia bacterium]|nr:hypothetical protein [Clostridia bacterium]
MNKNQNDLQENKLVICDSNGEQAIKVLYLKQRRGGFWLLIGLSFVWLCCGIGLIAYGYATGAAEANRVESFELLVILPILVLIMIIINLHKALYYLNTRVELYKHHFIYRNALGRRRSYSYSECVSRREKRPLLHQEYYTKSIIWLKDGTKLTIDEQIIESGFGAEIGYLGLKKR